MPERRAVMASLLVAPALAQSAWPSDRAIEVVIPYPPGGEVEPVRP